MAASLLSAGTVPIAGLFMQNWDSVAGEVCRAEEDRRDAAAVCGLLDIPFHVRNFAREYRERVFADFLKGYAAGLTPNPDVACNREIKFDTFLAEARMLGAERIATGHYARTDCVDGCHRLLRALDASKDQSYFLHALGQTQLAATIFPLGALHKRDVRALAREQGLPTARKRDSTGICFIEPGDFRSFLATHLKFEPGPIENAEGRVIGEHEGAAGYTIGQREGLGIGGVRGSSGAPWFVVGKDMARNTLIVDQGDSPLLYSRRMRVGEIHWISGEAPAAGAELSVQVRYRQDGQSCTLTMDRDKGAMVLFETAQRAVAPGQSAVFYQAEECLGGGTILQTDAFQGGLE